MVPTQKYIILCRVLTPLTISTKKLSVFSRVTKTKPPNALNIMTGGNPIVQHCQIHDGKEGGVMVLKNGTGQIENCDIFGNAWSGIIILGGNPIVQSCTIKQNILVLCFWAMVAWER